MINARAETVAQKPSFRTAFRKRRCLVVADGFFEWQKQPMGPTRPPKPPGSGPGRRGKQPYFITAMDGEPFAFAGLWERWEPSPRESGEPIIESCTIVTTEANAALKPIHDRMPVMLAPDSFDAWLDVDGWPAERAVGLLKPYPAERTVAVPVSTRVNNVRNDDPGCIAPLGDERA